MVPTRKKIVRSQEFVGMSFLYFLNNTRLLILFQTKPHHVLTVIFQGERLNVTRVLKKWHTDPFKLN